MIISNFKCQISNVQKKINNNPLVLEIGNWDLEIRNSLQSKAGFTLIELLLVVAMLLVLGSSSTLFYSRFFLQSSVGNTVDRLTGSFRKAQMYSMTGKQNDTWSVNYSTNTITLYKGNVYATRDATFDEKFTVGTNITITGLTTITFARLTGTPSSTLALTISGGGNSKTLNLNSQGVVMRQ